MLWWHAKDDDDDSDPHSHDVYRSHWRAYVRDLLNCTGTQTSSKYSLPAVLPANIQLDSGCTDCVAQLGYVRCATTAYSCGVGVPKDGKPHFIWSFVPNTGGVPYLADGWYGSAPIVGNRYRFKIYLGSSNSYWNYCIRNLSIGQAYKCYTLALIVNEWPSLPDHVWWGTEVQNTAAGMGPACCNNDIFMRWMQYDPSGSTSWQVVTGLSGCNRRGTPPTYYHCFISNTVDADGNGLLDDDETIQSHTDDHG